MNYLLLILLFIGACSNKQSYELSILHMNDTHAKHEAIIKTNKTTGEVITNGGEAQLAGVLAEEKTLNPNTLILHAGDTMTGSVYTLIYKGVEASELMNMSGIHIATLGNHAFDFGLEGAYNMLSVRKFPTISANIFESDTGNLLLDPYILTNIGGKSIAIIGLMVNEEVFTERLGSPGYIKVTDGIETLKTLFTTDKTLAKADIFLLLSHSGFEYDTKIAKAFPNKFAVIIGGHSHTLLEQPVKIGNTLIVQTENNLKRVGRLDLTFKGRKTEAQYKQILLTNTAYDTNVVAYIKDKKVLVDSQMGQKIGVLIGDDLEDSNIRQKSIPLGNFLTDLLLDIYKDSAIDFALINSGSVRTSINHGDITLKTMFELHPFDNTAYVVTLSGATIHEILARSADKNWNEGGFLMLSKGLEVTTDSNRMIKSITFNGSALNLDKEYKVLISDWMYNGGDGYTMIIPNAKEALYVGSDFRDMFIKKIKEQKIFNTSDIDLTERWKFSE
ncbi:MAG: bifunctional metallophosphatase/5'-nucleotidase [Brevinema sp.]